ncbi:U3 small nucleolar ribonucleoprotein protein MPP10-like [Cynara cardunculus var. scolymus]|uniref:U3 small nucleolar ribonucleoprotein protein MPP10 n=1 Tax=Cynara cardunculus var. scolymus TaxID=59895 RepID=A0A103YC29_CYNCS|nr:U3 small nucleolar ribonucleoprotein protein MPP10-like [Cynara cardunculus var. scolymus]KVI06353.1 Mpp10 protein [Cynara cardunculus var. scolymus]
MVATPSAGVEALHRLKLTEPLMYLTPSSELATAARIASEHLFASLKPYTPKSPFDRLLVDEKFDAEQIWQQIDLQSQPLISAIRRQVNKFEKDPQELKDIFKSGESDQEQKRELVLEGEKEEDSDEEDDELDDESNEEEDEDEDEMEEDESGDGEREHKERGGVGVEDKFLNIQEMKEFMEDDEAREYGVNKKKQVMKKITRKFGEDDEEEDDDEDDDDDDDELGVLELAGEEDMSDAEDARYEDFFTSTKKRDQSKKPKVSEKVEDIDISNEEETEDSDTGDEDNDGMGSDDEMKTDNLSTHEKQLLEQRAKIEEVERENLEAKSWTMQGEVNATKRPKNSALEVDLDWERNAKPPPVITEEVSQSIEELIMKRISEGHFDDVQKAPSLPSKAPREMKELDENQSKKGLGEIYADEYAQKTGLVSQALSFSDEQKKEASLLFKKLCLKLDALSHFHFTPKPVIEDMSIQTNVPALAMEEIAPLAVSDAAMLAPEEVFSGKGDIKEEAELTQEDRKRRRAHKKRKFKAENAKRIAKKPRENTETAADGNEES